MRTQELELLQQLVRCGSVSEAARSMHTTQPNASKMLKKIENHFGLQIFNRQNGRLFLTEEGRLLSEQAEATLISLQRLESRARNLREMRHGSLSVGTTPQLSRDWVPNIMARFMLAFPNVITSIQTRNSRKLIELVVERQLDFALGLLAIDDPNVECRKLFDIELLAALPKGHKLCRKKKLSAKDFHQQDFITGSMLDRSREQIEEFLKQHDAKPIERGEASLSCTRLRLIEQGIGIAMVDSFAAAEYTGNKVEFRALDPAMQLTVWIMKSKFQAKSRLLDSFESLVNEQILSTRMHSRKALYN